MQSGAAGFLTGQYAFRHGVLNHAEHARWDDRLVTFCEPLSLRGYVTALIGKWHMPGSPLPKLRGVDHFTTFTIQDGQGKYHDCPLVVDGVEQPSSSHYLPTELTDRALQFIERERTRPFCVYLCHKSVHHPWQPAQEDRGRYADRPVSLPGEASIWAGLTDGNLFGGVTRPLSGAYRSYMETVTSMDREIGRMLTGLDALGLTDDTVVVYASDNGFLFGEHRKTELRWPLEEVLRVPLLVRLPGGSVGGTRSQLATNLDVAPTLLALAGAAPLSGAQGRSLLPQLLDPAASGRSAFLVENTREFPYPVPSYVGVRTERHLYGTREGRFPPTLHDLVRDPRQTRDLYGTREGDALADGLRTRLATLASERFGV